VEFDDEKLGHDALLKVIRDAGFEARIAKAGLLA
jgi:hypothetical protein